MPYRARYRNRPRRFRRRRHYRGYRRNHYAVSKWNPSISLLPDKLFTKLRYSQTFTITAIGLQQQVFSGNQISDPDVTSPGGGLLPRGYLQLAAIYTRYHVTSSKITLRSSESLQKFQICVYPTNTTSAPSTFDRAVDHARSRSRLVGIDEVGVMTNWCSTKGALGERYTHSQTGITHIPPNPPNPVVNQWFWNTMITNSTSSAPSILVHVIIDYNVMWFSRANLLVDPSSSA